MHSYIKNIAVFLFILTTTIVQAQDPNFHIYLLIGQSNMEGAGKIETQDKSGVDARFKVMGATDCTATRSFELGEWSTAIPPIVRCYTGLGVGDYFGRTMLAELPSHIKVGVIPVAIGGCDIALFDKLNYAKYVATAPDWMKDIITQYGGNPYGRLVEMALLAQKDGVIKGILFHQGETNTGNTTWKNKVKDVVDNLKEDLDLGDIPFLAGELLASEGACCSSHNVEINKLPEVITNAHVISSVGLTGADNAHFTSASYRLFGERYATKMLELIEVDTASVTAIDNELAQSQVTVYPVPVVNGSINMQNLAEVKHIELYEMDGRKIATFENTYDSSTMFMQVNTNSSVLLFKLISANKINYLKVLVQ